ncbi:MAG: hypothetical protein L0216_06655, partial [Planctomycetales bacterium]|nr:hypothetical protein [Planctomycetales bacterium]
TVAAVRRAAKAHLRPAHFVATIAGDIAAVRAAAAAGGFGIPGEPVELPLPDPYTLERPK